MRTQLRVLSPGKLPVPLGDVKRHIGVSSDDHDTDIETLIRSAASELVRRTGRVLTTTRLELTLPCFAWTIELPYPPLASIVSFEYRDTDGNLQSLVSTDYQLAQPDDIPSTLTPAMGTDWPATQDDRSDAVVITYDAGVDDIDSVPPEAVLFINHLCRHRYDNPDGHVGMDIRSWDSLVRSLWIGDYVSVSAY